MTPTIQEVQRALPWTVPYGAQFVEAGKRHQDVYFSQALLHAQKSLGKLASAIEQSDHGHYTARNTPDQIGKDLASLVMSAMRMANLAGIDLWDHTLKHIDEKNGTDLSGRRGLSAASPSQGDPKPSGDRATTPGVSP